MIPDPQSSENTRSIRIVARAVQGVAILAICIFILITVVGDISIALSDTEAAAIDASTFGGAKDRLTYLPYHLSALAAFVFLFRLFGHFAHGRIFTRHTVADLRCLSLSVAASGLNKIGVGVYAAGLEVLDAKPDVALTINVTGGALMAVFAGLLLYALALVLKEAKMQTEDLRLIF
ncbi:DUF2975 domain-containing protein [uncultured Algimonas sp.]|uniref:DUF2975 domain-containing protein n=1 Tax=uncultured Algimonas sp. TaxID=1547920 RepID=UPI0026231B0C|nr:DUF2975 domain-containing protein [uncultured Algimonas sp.]